MNAISLSVQAVIRDRRSVKPSFYSIEKVEDEIILAMLESARWAPTHGLSEPWRFFVFTGDGLNKLADFLSNLYRSQSSVNFLQTKQDKIKTNILRSSHIILIGMQRQSSGKIPETEEICAVASAVQNMQLVASASGVGCYWSTGSLSTHDETKKFMGLGAPDLAMGMLYVGNYTAEIAIPARTEIGAKTSWIRE